MGTGQAQPKIEAGNALDTSETTSNVATNKAELDALRAANVDGKDIYPKNTTTDHLFASDGVFQGYMKAGALSVGSDGVSISSAAAGATPTTGLIMNDSVLQLIKDSTAVVSLNGADGSATFKGTISAGSSISGTMSAGTIAVGSGGVTIGSATSGIGIYSNKLTCVVGGVPTITLDGDTGIITATKVNLTTDATSSVTMSSGTINLGNSVQVGGATTLGGMQTATGNAQSTANTANSTANTANSTANSAYNVAIGAIQPGGGVVADGSKYITRINTTSGIVVGTSTTDSGARTQMTSAGIAIYNSADTLVVQADHTYGLWVNTANASPGVTERISLAYLGTEKGQVYAHNNNGMTVWASNNLTLYGLDQIKLDTDGNIVLNGKVFIASSSTGPSVTTGTAPTQGAAATGYNAGSLLLSSGGSLWIVNGSGNWDRIFAYTTNAATAHNG